MNNFNIIKFDVVFPSIIRDIILRKIASYKMTDYNIEVRTFDTLLLLFEFYVRGKIGGHNAAFQQSFNYSNFKGAVFDKEIKEGKAHRWTVNYYTKKKNQPDEVCYSLNVED